jgi:hypothetical protein
MPFSLKENEREAREALRAFWAGASLGRPALHVTVRGPDYVKADWPGPGEEVEDKEHDFLPAWHAWRMDEYLKSTLFLAEAMPGTILRMGTLLVTVAILAGGDYEFHSNSGWIQVLPDIWDRPTPTFDPRSPAACGIEACLRSLAWAVGRRGFVSPPIMLDGLTTLSSFRTPRQLCLDVVERPDDVRRWSDALTTLYIDAYEHYYRLCQQLGYGDTCTWLSAMAEGRMEAVQCDFAIMLSPRMFEQFALPDLRRLTEYMSYSLYHLDGTPQMRFLDLLRTLPRLNGIQWNPEPPAGSPVGWIEAFREIRKRRFSLHIHCGSVGEAIEITRALGPDGLLLVLPRFDTLREAEQAIRDIQAAVL